MEHKDQKKKIKLAGTYDATYSRYTRQTLKEALSQPKTKVGKPSLTWIKLVEQNLQPIIQLEFNTNTAETSIQRLEAITEDRNKWEQLIKNIMVGNN